MSKYTTRLLSLLLVLQLIIPCATFAAAVGEFTSVFGNVTQARAKEVIKPVAKSSIEVKDVIVTDRASATAMVFADDSSIMLSENTKLEIEEFLFKGKSRRGIFSLAVGKLMVNVKKYIGGNNVFEVYSPTAAIGVRGTGFEFVEAIKEGNIGSNSANQSQRTATVACTEGSLNVSAFSATGVVVSTAVIEGGQIAVIREGVITIFTPRATGLGSGSGMVQADRTPKSPQQTKTPPLSKSYNPLSDPNLKAPVPIGDRSQAEKYTRDFQKGQWSPLEQKEQRIKEQQPGQPQPPGYLSPSTTTTHTTVPQEATTTFTTVTPGGTSTPTTVPSGGTTTPSTVRPGRTTTPTTMRPGGTTTATTAKPATATTGTTPQNLTDVTVDRRDVTITVWDHGAEDGDIISITLNGKVLKSNLKLTNKKQSFQVKLTGGQNRFEVEAVNEGTTPPNTATVEISNVTKGKPSQVYERKKGQRASMNLTAP